MNITLIEDDVFHASLLRDHLKRHGFESLNHFVFISDAIHYDLKKTDVIILNHTVNGIAGIDYVRLLKSRSSHVQLIYLAPENVPVDILARAKFLGVDFFILKNAQFTNDLSKILMNESVSKKINLTTKKIGLKTYFSRQSKPSIYHLDDDPLFTHFIRYKLNKYETFELEIFTQIEDLLKRSERTPPSLLLLDYSIYDRTGLDVLSEFLKISPATKVVMFSAQTNLSIALNLFDAGIADYIVKNPSWETALIEIIEKHLNLNFAINELV